MRSSYEIKMNAIREGRVIDNGEWLTPIFTPEEEREYNEALDRENREVEAEIEAKKQRAIEARKKAIKNSGLSEEAYKARTTMKYKANELRKLNEEKANLEKKIAKMEKELAEATKRFEELANG